MGRKFWKEEINCYSFLSVIIRLTAYLHGLRKEFRPHDGFIGANISQNDD